MTETVKSRQTVQLHDEDFTPRAEDTFYAVVDHPTFFRQDAELIYQALREGLKAVSFGEYLRRFIYRKAEITQPFEAVPISEYQDIIVDSFQSHGVPAAFTPTTSRVRAVAKNWLVQQSVSRDVVLLLGFGLNMSPQDVDELLMKGLQEDRLNPDNPREALCKYCYEHHLGFYKFQDLFFACLQGNTSGGRPEEENRVIAAMRILRRKQEEKTGETESRRQFLQLYSQAQRVTAEILDTESETDYAAGNRKKPDQREQKQVWLQRAKKTGKRLHPEDITPADLERVLQAAIPRDHHGNLLPMKKSTLYYQFRGRRLSRQRLEELLSDSAPVSRYDLLSLHFYAFSQQREEGESRLQRYRRFIEEANRILEPCGMGPVYTANPYECFLLMCVMSEDPLGTYADVIEQSYAEAET